MFLQQRKSNKNNLINFVEMYSNDSNGNPFAKDGEMEIYYKWTNFQT